MPAVPSTNSVVATTVELSLTVRSPTPALRVTVVWAVRSDRESTSRSVFALAWIDSVCAVTVESSRTVNAPTVATSFTQVRAVRDASSSTTMSLLACPSM